jgi:predicted dehydrogenase
MLTAVLAGCGAMSKAWLEAAAKVDQLSIAGLVDIDIERARGRAKEFGLTHASIGADLSAVLAQSKPTMVFDVALPQVRLDLVRTAFAHGCHVLTEKPMAASLTDAQEIIRLSRQAKRVHAVVQNRRYLANVRRIRRFIDSGALGRPTSIHCDFFIAPHFGGFREEMDHVLLVDMAIHTFDAARYIINAEAANVFCREREPLSSWYRSGSSAFAIFEMSNGATFTYRGSWSAKGFKTSWESAWRIVCERGTLVWDGFDDLRAEAETGERDGLFDVMAPAEVPGLDPSDAVGGHLGIIQDFIKAIQDGTEPETRGSDNIKSLAMVFGAVESSAAGRPVNIVV